MLARILLALSLIQVLVIYVPMPVWGLWMLHFGALEACLLASVSGGIALLLGTETWHRALALVGLVGGLIPALSVIPLYRQEGISFSAWEWLTGGSPPEVTIERDLSLIPGLSADLYRAPGAGPHPFVMVIHGGSWRNGSKGEVPGMSRAMAAAGFSVLDVNYRLSGEAQFPAAVSDVKCWLAAVRAHAATLNVDPERGVLLGRSAGGQVALVAAYSDASIGPTCRGEPAKLRGVISIYGPTDMAWSHANPFVPDVVRGTEALEAYLGGPPGAVPAAYEMATPQHWVRQAQGTLPATLLLHGKGERCVRARNAEMLVSALAEKKQPVEVVLIPFADHGFDVRPGGFGEQVGRGVILRFLADHLRR